MPQRRHVPFANELTHSMGLPVLCAGQAQPFRTRRKCAKLRAASMFRQPEFLSINPSEMDFERKLNFTAKAIGFPAVVKPTELMSSMGVLKVDSEAQLRDAVILAGSIDFPGENLRNHYELSNDVIVEAYVEGQEYSVEGICQRGELLHWSLTKKIKCQKPYFDEVGHIAGPPLAKELLPELDTKLRSLTPDHGRQKRDHPYGNPAFQPRYESRRDWPPTGWRLHSLASYHSARLSLLGMSQPAFQPGAR